MTTNGRKAGFRLASIAGLFSLSVFAWAQESTDSSAGEIDALRAEVEELRNYAVRSQAHVMIDVEYHFANLWFAGRDERWDLASFYLRESRSHIGWAVRVRPVRPISGGAEVDLRPMQQAIEQAGLASLAEALEQRNPEAFEAAYRQTLDQCNACHQAAERGYLEVRVPNLPPSPLVTGAR
jgi:hypothetical protein